MKNQKENRGGKRPKSGRKKADYKTKTISFRVREEFAEPIKKIVKTYVADQMTKIEALNKKKNRNARPGDLN